MLSIAVARNPIYLVRLIANPHLQSKGDCTEIIIGVTNSRLEAESFVKSNPHYEFLVGIDKPSLVLDVMMVDESYFSLDLSKKFLLNQIGFTLNSPANSNSRRMEYDEGRLK